MVGPFLKRALALIAGLATFVAVLSLVAPAIDAMSNAFFKTTDFPGGQPNDRFVVALREPGKAGGKDAYAPATWKQIPAIKASGRKFTFLMGGTSGALSSQGDLYRYKVIDDRKTSQIIEVMFSNTHTSWSRYEAFEDRIVPISYRTDGSFLSLIPALALLAVAVFAGRRVTRLLRQALGVA